MCGEYKTQRTQSSLTKYELMAVCNKPTAWNNDSLSWSHQAKERSHPANNPLSSDIITAHHGLLRAFAFRKGDCAKGVWAHLDELWGEASGDADPVDGGDEAVSRHQAEDERAQLLPLLAEVMRVDLSKEDGQDHGQNRDQVHLPPVLQGEEGQEWSRTISTF